MWHRYRSTVLVQWCSALGGLSGDAVRVNSTVGSDECNILGTTLDEFTFIGTGPPDQLAWVSTVCCGLDEKDVNAGVKVKYMAGDGTGCAPMQLRTVTPFSGLPFSLVLLLGVHGLRMR